ncbi:MAG: hypothetical protein HUJ59_03990 [Bacilli bacterium]|nr:hypothetical protein [Bacilli bacterium]
MRRSLLIFAIGSMLLTSCGKNTKGWKDFISDGLKLDKNTMPLSINMHVIDKRKYYSEEEEYYINFVNEGTITIAWEEINDLIFNPVKTTIKHDDFTEWFHIELNYFDATYDFEINWKSYHSTYLIFNGNIHENFGGFYDNLVAELREAKFMSYQAQFEKTNIL